MKQIPYQDAMAATVEKMARGGVFLSAGLERPNTMTIGWGAIGYMWNRPVFIAMVRPSRHTKQILDETGCFTVSVPTKAPLKAQLAFAGAKSGREVDKFDGHGLTAAPAQTVGAEIVRECGLHFECRVRLVQDLGTERMDPQVQQSAYPDGDVHALYFGEITAVYTTDE